MKKLWQELINKNFTVYVGGEFESKTDFTGLIKLFTDYSDFLSYDRKTQKESLKEWLEVGKIYVDTNIYVKIF